MFKIEDKKVVDVICDHCHKSCSVGHTTHDNGDKQLLYEYASINCSWGPGSGKNGQDWTAEICEACTDKLLVPSISFKTET